jgi:hypothetical protein
VHPPHGPAPPTGFGPGAGGAPRHPPGAGPQTWTRGPDQRWREQGRRPPGAEHPPPGAPQWAPHRYPPEYRSHERFRVGPWFPPPGYYRRAWRYGELLPPDWFAPDDLIQDWWDFGLPAPPPGYAWIRVAGDALLIDDYDGRIVQVVREVFW